MPVSVHSRFIAASNSSEKGSVSSIRVITSTTIFASDYMKEPITQNNDNGNEKPEFSPFY
jgi:hypothetical protein